MEGHTPHVMLYVGALNCRNWRKVQPTLPRTSANRKLIIEMNAIFQHGGAEKRYDYDSVWMLLLEQGTGLPLNDFLRRNSSLTWGSFLKPVLLQVLYTLLCFKQVGFKQNDLHLGNVWIDELPQKHVFVYQMDADNAWVLETKYMVKFFDFDRAAKSSTEYNQKHWTNTLLDSHDYCRSSGQCNEFTRFFDAFNLLYGLYHTRNLSDNTRTKFRTWITRFVNRALFEKKWAWGGQMCECEDDDCKTCSLLQPAEENSLELILAGGFSDDYKLDLNVDRIKSLLQQQPVVWRPPSMANKRTASFIQRLFSGGGR